MTDKTTFNPTSLSLNSTEEAKLDAFNYHPINGLRIGMSMVDGSNLQYLDIPLYREFQSLQTVMNSETLIRTYASRQGWLNLLNANSDSVLQYNCNREGLNNVAVWWYGYGGISDMTATRIGIIANGENDCESCDSYVGFGITNNYSGGYFSLSCGGGSTSSCCGSTADGIIRLRIGYILGTYSP